MQLNKQQVNEMSRVERQNKQRMYQVIENAQGGKDIEEYKEAYRKLYFQQAVFKSKKAKELLQRTLQELNPSLHYTDQTELILKNIAKVFLIELFEQAIQVRSRTPQKTDIDQQILQDAYRRLKNKVISQKM